MGIRNYGRSSLLTSSGEIEGKYVKGRSSRQAQKLLEKSKEFQVPTTQKTNYKVFFFHVFVGTKQEPSILKKICKRSLFNNEENNVKKFLRELPTGRHYVTIAHRMIKQTAML